MRVAVFGLGYVGTVTAAGLASQGHHVVGVDVDTLKVETIRDGRSPVVEPGVEELIHEAVAAGLLTATHDSAVALERADVSLICVGTPSGPGGGTDLGFISRAVADIRRAMETAAPPEVAHAVVMRSTVPPGTVEELVAPHFDAGSLPAGWRAGAAMCPEFLREGSGVRDFFAPPFVVVGVADEQTRSRLEDLFAFLGQQIYALDVRSAEALKYACNAFHATKVSFANELGRLLRVLGVDSREVMRVFCEDTKLNIAATYLRPGFAYGGSCLPKDLRALQFMARMSGIDVPLLAGAAQTNELVVREVVDRIIASGARSVCILGLSFKSDTDDLRESPNVELAERLIGKGFDVRIFDPLINPEGLRGTNLRYVEGRLPHLNKLLTSSARAAVAAADAVVVASHEESIVAAVTAADARLVLDLDGRLGSEVEALQAYEGVAW